MNKIAVIAGGARSLGKFLSIELYKTGYVVIVLDKNQEQLDYLKKEHPSLIAMSCDLTSENSVVNTFQNIKKEFKNIDLLVYNAGYANSSKITDFSFKEFERTININLTGYFLASREASKIMIQNNTQGNIIQINSKSGAVGSKYNSAYSAAKFGGVGLTQSLALDLAEHNIRVNSLMIGNLLNSDMFESLIPSYAKKLNIEEKEVKQHYIDKVPLRRGCEFKDVLNVLSFYVSDKASYCTGQSIKITGGQVM